jgi:hypothetical protein
MSFHNNNNNNNNKPYVKIKKKKSTVLEPDVNAKTADDSSTRVVINELCKYRFVFSFFFVRIVFNN